MTSDTRWSVRAPTAALPGPSSGRTLAQREARWGLTFISPWLLGFVLFTGLPMVASLVMSLTDFDPRDPGAVKFIGLDNYARMVNDPTLVQSLMVTLKFGVLTVPATIVFALAVAMLVNNKLLAGRSVFRTLFYMPMQIPLVASTIIWLGVFNLHHGWMDLLLGTIGIRGPDWMNDTVAVYPGLGLMGLWGIGNMMLIFLAGLQGVPTSLYEAARVDGAGRWAQFRHITLPGISTVLFYNLIIALIATFQYFTQAFVLTNGRGDPDNATLFYTLNLYREGWKYFQMGYAAALAWLMFAIVLVLMALLFRTARTWVYEAGGDR